MYKSFDVNSLISYGALRTGTNGYQSKYLTQDRTIFIKEQAIINNQLRDDWIVEVFACKVADVLGIGRCVVEQKPCVLNYGSYKRYGVYSDNFEVWRGIKFLPFKSLLTLNCDDLEVYAFTHQDAMGKINILSKLISQYTQIPIKDTLQYLLNMAVLDIFTGNSDRHLRNFGCCVESNGKYRIAPIFDNGLGLGEFVSDKRYCHTIADYQREAYVAPYGEDPLDMLHILNNAYGIGNKLKKRLPALRKLCNVRMPDNIYAKTYYKSVLDTIGRL